MQAEKEKSETLTVEERPEEVDIPEEIEKKEGVKAVKTQFTARVESDAGKPLTQSPVTRKVSIQLPADENQIKTWSEGPIANSLTWLGVYWDRMIKKAIHFRWNIVKSSGLSTNKPK